MLILSDSSPKIFADHRTIEDTLRKRHISKEEKVRNTTRDWPVSRDLREMKKDREKKRCKRREREETPKERPTKERRARENRKFPLWDFS